MKEHTHLENRLIRLAEQCGINNGSEPNDRTHTLVTNPYLGMPSNNNNNVKGRKLGGKKEKQRVKHKIKTYKKIIIMKRKSK